MSYWQSPQGWSEEQEYLSKEKEYEGVQMESDDYWEGLMRRIYGEDEKFTRR